MDEQSQTFNDAVAALRKAIGEDWLVAKILAAAKRTVEWLTYCIDTVTRP